MAFYITQNTRTKAARNQKTPNLVFSIDGIETQFGVVTISKYIKIGDPGLEIGDDWVIGGLNSVDDQLNAITFDGTSTSINQKLDPDKSSSSSISTMSIAMIDINGAITDIISPGVEVADILGRKAVVSLGFAGTAWPDDYIKIFRGIIDSVSYGPQKTTFNLSHPDQKKRQDIFIKKDTTLDGGISNSDTTITVPSTTGFFAPILGPDGNYDSNITYGLRIDDEIIFYTGLTGTTFTGCTRGQLGTTAVLHDDEAQVDSFIMLGGNVIDIALKLMLSGWNGPWVSGIEVEHINYLADLTVVPNSLFFSENIVSDYGVSVGDWVTISGAIDGGNDIVSQIIDIELVDTGGSYLTLADTLINEPDTTAVVSFRSQYDTLADGMKFQSDEVDIIEHERIKRLFLSSFDLNFYLKDTVNGKEFLEQQLYFPAAAYSIPRKSQVSLGYHIGPIPGVDTKIFTSKNVKNASKIQINRSINKNFYNTIVYRYEELPLEEKFIRGTVDLDATSQTDIPIGTKALVITSKGMRDLLGGQNLAQVSSLRRLKRYKRGAEYIDNFEVLYGDSFNVEIGDIIILEGPELKMVNTTNASRDGEPKLYEIVNKTFDIHTGSVKLQLINTNYSANTRYGLMSPSSRIESATSDTVFKIRQTGNSIFGIQEGQKWSRYVTPGAVVNVRVRSDDFTTRNAVSTIQSVLGNTITLATGLGFTPLAGDCMTMDHYDSMSDTLKLIYAWMRNEPGPFNDGKKLYEMIG